MTRMWPVVLATLFLLAPAAHAACPPVPFVFAAGPNPIRPDQINANFDALRNCVSTAIPVNSVTNTAAVRALAANAFPFVQRTYNTVPGDGEAIYYWSAASTCTDDGQTCIRPASNPATGRWVLSATVGGNLLLNPGGGTNFSFNSASQISRLTFNATTSGAAGSTPTDQAGAALVWLRNTGTMTGLGVNHHIATLEADYNDSGTTVNNDSFVGVAANCNLLGTRPNAGIPGGTLAAACVGSQVGSRGYTSQGGNLGLGQPQGQIHGLNVVAGVSIGPGPTVPSGYNDHEGIEVDMVGCVGCTVNHRLGIYLVDFGDSAGGMVEQGTQTDAAIAIASVAGTVGWRYGIDFVGLPISAGNALNNGGTVLGSSASTPTVAAQGIDLNNFLISGNAFRGPAGTFTVTGAGDVLSNSSTSKTFIADTVLATPGMLQFRTAGVANWSVRREATTQDFTIFNDAGSLTYFRLDAATGDTTLGPVDGVSVSNTGVLIVPGGGVVVGAPPGGAKGVGTVNIAGAFYVNNVIGATCGPGAPTAGFTVSGGIVVAC